MYWNAMKRVFTNVNQTKFLDHIFKVCTYTYMYVCVLKTILVMIYSTSLQPDFHSQSFEFVKKNCFCKNKKKIILRSHRMRYINSEGYIHSKSALAVAYFLYHRKFLKEWNKFIRLSIWDEFTSGFIHHFLIRLFI